MFIFPLMAVASQNDEMSQIAVQSIITDFANTVAQQGKITLEEYNRFIQKLHSTGNTFDVELEAKILDENPGRKVTILNQEALGENVYYSEYTNIIEEQLYSDTATYRLKKGDYIIVSVKNTNTTLGTQLKNFLYNIIGKDSYTIGATVSTLVINTGKLENYDTTVAGFGGSVAPVEPSPTPEPENPTPVEPSPTPESQKIALLNEILSYNGKFLKYSEILQLGTTINTYLDLIAEIENNENIHIWTYHPTNPNNQWGQAIFYNRPDWETCWMEMQAPQGNNCLYLVDISEFSESGKRLELNVINVTYNEILLDKDMNFFNTHRTNFVQDENGSKDYNGISPYKYIP